MLSCWNKLGTFRSSEGKLLLACNCVIASFGRSTYGTMVRCPHTFGPIVWVGSWQCLYIYIYQGKAELMRMYSKVGKHGTCCCGSKPGENVEHVFYLKFKILINIVIKVFDMQRLTLSCHRCEPASWFWPVWMEFACSPVVLCECFGFLPQSMWNKSTLHCP